MAAEFIRLKELNEGISTGDYDVLREAYRLLVATNFYYPIPQGQTEQTIYTRKGQLVPNSLTAQGKPCVSLFTSGLKLLSWSSEWSSHIEVAGNKVSKLIAHDIWLSLNSGQDDEVLLSPSNLTAMIYVGEIDEHLLSGVLESEEEQEDFELEEVSIANAGDVQRDLEIILSNYQFVKEAYYVHNNRHSDTVALGLLTDEMDVEQRFLMMAEVAEISRKQFGLAGAIDVFDDLNVESSPSWELFSVHSPFYVAQDLEEPQERLKDKLHVISTKQANNADDVSDDFKQNKQKKVVNSFWTTS